MYDDDEEDDDPFSNKYAQERDSIPAMERAVREYLVDPENYGLTEEKANELIALPEAQEAIRSSVALRSFIYYAGDKVAELNQES